MSSNEQSLTTTSRSRAYFLIALVLFAFLVRFAAALLLRNVHAGPGSQTGADGIEYNALGLQLTRGHGYALTPGHPTSFRAPGYPFSLAAIYYIFGEQFVVTYLVSCLIGALTCLFTYFLARELLTERWARMAGVLLALYLPHIYFATVFDSENLFGLCLAAGLWSLAQCVRTRSVAWATVGGLLLGYAALTRPFSLLLLPIVLGILISTVPRNIRRRAALAAAFAISFICVVLPWTLRNYAVHGSWVLVATNGGSTFYGGNNDIVLHDRHYLGGWITTVRLPGRAAIEAMPSEVTHDRKEWSLGFQWVEHHLSTVPILLLMKLGRFVLPDIDSGNRNYVLLQIVGATPMLIAMFCGVGLVTTSRRYRSGPWCLIHCTVAATLLTVLVFWGGPRFRDANAPILMLYAVIGVRHVILARARSASAKEYGPPPGG